MRADPLDRAAHLRVDAAFLDAARRDLRTRLVPIWRGRSLVQGRPARALTPTVGEAPALLDVAEHVVFLGLDAGVSVLMLDLPPAADPPAIEGGSFLDLSVVGMQLNADERALLSYARAMAYWHRSHRHDPKTGLPTRLIEGGFARQGEDGTKHFPRTDPAVMALIVDADERCLLARGPSFPPGMYSALAGFVEPGETLEACVLRETREEVGLEVESPRYFGSQPWPFPRSLMIGFIADAVTTELSLDEKEITSARWLTRAEVLKPEGFFIPPALSLAHHLILAWARGEI